MDKDELTDIFWLIASILAIILLIFAFPGCKTVKTAMKDTTDSVRIIEKYVERVDTVTVNIPVEVYRVETYDTISVINGGVAKSVAKYDNGKLLHTLDITGSVSVPVVNKEEVKEKENTHKEKEIVEVNKLTKWQKVQQGGFWAILAAFIGGVVYLFVKRKKNV